MINHPFPLKTICAAVLLCAAAAAQADIVVYTSQAAFLAAVANPGTDTYDDLSMGSYPTPLSRTAGPYSYSAGSGPFGPLYGLSEGGDGWLSTADPHDSILFSSFSPGVSAVGGYFFGTEASGAFTPNTSVTLTAFDGSTLTYSVTQNDSTTDGFLGFVSSSPLNSVLLSPDASGEYYVTANNLTLAMPIPEPGTYAMLMAGMCLLGVMARRRS